jgi:hypothetical protein
MTSDRNRCGVSMRLVRLAARAAACSSAIAVILRGMGHDVFERLPVLDVSAGGLPFSFQLCVYSEVIANEFSDDLTVCCYRIVREDCGRISRRVCAKWTKPSPKDISERLMSAKRVLAESETEGEN